MTDSTSITLDEAVRRHVTTAIVKARGNLTKAAKALEVDRRTLHRMLDRWGIRHVQPQVVRRDAVVELVRHYAEGGARIGERK